MILVLQALEGELASRQFSFPFPSFCVLGRARECNVCLPGDETVSRTHCLIELGPSEVWVQDLGSLNGTLVNGVKIGQRMPQQGDATILQPARQTLHDGDELRLGAHRFSVRVFEQTRPWRSRTAEPGLRQRLGWEWRARLRQRLEGSEVRLPPGAYHDSARGSSRDAERSVSFSRDAQRSGSFSRDAERSA